MNFVKHNKIKKKKVYFEFFLINVKRKKSHCETPCNIMRRWECYSEIRLYPLFTDNNLYFMTHQRRETVACKRVQTFYGKRVEKLNTVNCNYTFVYIYRVLWRPCPAQHAKANAFDSYGQASDFRVVFSTRHHSLVSAWSTWNGVQRPQKSGKRRSAGRRDDR